MNMCNFCGQDAGLKFYYIDGKVLCLTCARKIHRMVERLGEFSAREKLEEFIVVRDGKATRVPIEELTDEESNAYQALWHLYRETRRKLHDRNSSTIE